MTSLGLMIPVSTRQSDNGQRTATIANLRSYLPDWILTLVLAILAYQIPNIFGFRREFSLNDISTLMLYMNASPWALYLTSMIGPAILIPLINLVFVRSLWDLHNSLLGLAGSLSLAATIVSIVKVTVGRPRPDLISRCQPAAGSADHQGWGLSTYSICTQTDEHILKDGFRSFPSGHATLSFAGLGFLSFYLAGKLRLWSERGNIGKTLLSLAPLVGASLIAISRTMDYRHHWEDVTVGAMLGLTVSYFSYRLFFPSISQSASELPYPSRVELTSAYTRHSPQGYGEENQSLLRREDAE